MNAWEQFKQAVVGRQLRLIRREFDWVFDFGGGLGLTVETLWRLRNSNGIMLTSDDDGHQFGLPAPLDAEERSNDHLGSAAVVSLDDGPVTPDLTVRLSNGLAVDVIARSSGYESWQATGGEAFIVGRCD